jgi:hypothetical protein
VFRSERLTGALLDTLRERRSTPQSMAPIGYHRYPLGQLRRNRRAHELSDVVAGRFFPFRKSVTPEIGRSGSLRSTRATVRPAPCERRDY